MSPSVHITWHLFNTSPELFLTSLLVLFSQLPGYEKRNDYICFTHEAPNVQEAEIIPHRWQGHSCHSLGCPQLRPQGDAVTIWLQFSPLKSCLKWTIYYPWNSHWVWALRSRGGLSMRFEPPCQLSSLMTQLSGFMCQNQASWASKAIVLFSHQLSILPFYSSISSGDK